MKDVDIVSPTRAAHLFPLKGTDSGSSGAGMRKQQHGEERSARREKFVATVSNVFQGNDEIPLQKEEEEAVVTSLKDFLDNGDVGFQDVWEGIDACLQNLDADETVVMELEKSKLSNSFREFKRTLSSSFSDLLVGKGSANWYEEGAAKNDNAGGVAGGGIRSTGSRSNGKARIFQGESNSEFALSPRQQDGSSGFSNEFSSASFGECPKTTGGINGEARPKLFGEDSTGKRSVKREKSQQLLHLLASTLEDWKGSDSQRSPRRGRKRITKRNSESAKDEKPSPSGRRGSKNNNRSLDTVLGKVTVKTSAEERSVASKKRPDAASVKHQGGAEAARSPLGKKKEIHHHHLPRKELLLHSKKKDTSSSSLGTKKTLDSSTSTSTRRPRRESPRHRGVRRERSRSLDHLRKAVDSDAVEGDDSKGTNGDKSQRRGRERSRSLENKRSASDSNRGEKKTPDGAPEAENRSKTHHVRSRSRSLEDGKRNNLDEGMGSKNSSRNLSLQATGRGNGHKDGKELDSANDIAGIEPEEKDESAGKSRHGRRASKGRRRVAAVGRHRSPMRSDDASARRRSVSLENKRATTSSGMSSSAAETPKGTPTQRQRPSLRRKQSGAKKAASADVLLLSPSSDGNASSSRSLQVHSKDSPHRHHRSPRRRPKGGWDVEYNIVDGELVVTRRGGKAVASTGDNKGETEDNSSSLTSSPPLTRKPPSRDSELSRSNHTLMTVNTVQTSFL